jgi:protein-tyrosine-phosphatase/predicted ATP-grasp superfamily ATP-dependent carboligase
MNSGSANITLSAVRDWNAIETAWLSLEAEARPSFFQSWTWIGCLAEERFPDPVLLRAERDGRTVGLALLNRMQGRLGAERLLLNESGNPTLDAVYIEHNGVLLAREAGDLLPDCFRAILTAPIRGDGSRGLWSWNRQLRLSGVDDAHLSAARQVGRIRLLRESAAPFVDLMDLPGGSDAYIGSLSANTRYQIRRSDRKFAQVGRLEVRVAESLDEALAFLNALAELHQTTWSARGLPGAFANPAFLLFHRVLVERGLPRGEVMLLRVTSGAQVLGYLYNFRHHDHVIAYQSGFDYAAAAALADSHAKPGLTCHYAAITRAQADGAVVYDFLAGSDRYKRSLTRAERPLYWLEVVPQRSESKLRLPFTSAIPGGQETDSAQNVLVLGDDTRAFLATVRSLGRRGIKVHAAPANFRSPALASRYIAAIHELPPWMGDGVEWLSRMQTILRRTPFDLVIPCDETTLLPLQHHREQLASLARLAIPDDRAITILFDKHETRELAQRASVPTASGRLLERGDTSETVIAELGLPVVVKPRWSYSLHRLASRGKVQVAYDRTRLEQLLNGSAPNETVVEQFFPGQGVGISLLASRGRVLQAFEHHRVREIAGASFYRVSAPLTLEMMSACEAIVAAVPYTGLAMFEFKRNAQGKWVLLEINARPWGSMPLPLALGIDFPYRWYRLLTANEETPSVSYRIGVYGRNLFPDLMASKAEAELRQLGPAAMAKLFMQRGAELLRPLAGREVHDVLVRDDPGPALSELRPISSAARERVSRLLPGAVARRRRRARQQLARVLARPQKKALVLFVCQGNICRSPFAEALLRVYLGKGPIITRSAGLMPRPGRSTPDLGLRAAAAHSVDLSAHRSVWLTSELAEAASLLIVFDEINRKTILDRYPRLQTPVVSLGELLGLRNIVDPIDGDLAQFERVYGQIAEAIGVLARLLAGRNRLNCS